MKYWERIKAKKPSVKTVNPSSEKQKDIKDLTVEADTDNKQGI